MTPEYEARREAKHAAQFASRVVVPEVTGTIDLTPKTLGLAFAGMRQYRQSGLQRKNRSAHAHEHEQANKDNRNPYQGEDGLWYWFDETEQPCEVGFVTRDQAEAALNDYAKWLNGPKEVIAEPLSEIGRVMLPKMTELANDFSKEIGGINEDNGLPTAIAG
jgi:hypothetical protein